MNTRLSLWTPAAILVIAGSTHSLAGGPGPYGATLELSSLDGTNGFVLNGINAGDQSGISVSGAGDVNGDGIDDLIIGAFGADPNGSGSGESYVVFGGVGIGAGGTLELSSLNGSNGFVLNGLDADDRSGLTVSGAGDVNDDGIDDLIIGALDADPNGLTSGESYVVFGGVGVGDGGTLELSSLNGANGFVLNGIDAGDQSGASVSGAGDVNGDGIDDLVIGALYADPNGSGSGENYVVFGGVGIGAGGTLELSSLNGANGFVLNGIDANDQSGASVSGAGDFNGDGIDDLIIGAVYADPNGNGSAGESYVVFGGVGVGFSGAIELSSSFLNGFVLNGSGTDDQSGASVSGAGDFNGDGIEDIIIGARNTGNIDYSAVGECYVVFGGTVSQTWASSKLDLATITTSQLQGEFCLIINGTTKGDRVGDSVSGAGDVNGDGIDDIIIGARFRSPNGGYSGESFVVFGKAPAPDTIPGDINGDGIVDTADLGILIGNFGMMGP